VKPPGRKGFGSRLIEGGLAQDLDGEVRLDYDPLGVVCQIIMPVPLEVGR
jgi:two-component sensor histidine kinase